MKKQYKYVLATIAVVAIAAAVVGCGASKDPSNDSMGMSHSMGASGEMSGSSMSGHSMSGDKTMSGMAPMADGADGTSPRAGRLFLSASPTGLEPGKSSTVTLKVSDVESNKTVTNFEVDQTKMMHLIVVNHDFSEFQHLHPTPHPDGTFTVPVTVPRAGAYRAIADFTTGGKRYALGLDLGTAGKAKTQSLPAPATSTTVDGYDVKFSHGSLNAMKEQPLTFRVSKGGSAAELQPYLGAGGHLVALRKPDLAYSHVHPEGSKEPMGTTTFIADFPSSGTYRLYFQFRSGNALHVAEFTVRVK